MKSLVSLCIAVVVLVLPCAAQSKTPTHDETQAKIAPLTDQQLVDCLKGPKDCPVDTHDYDVNDIKWTLVNRKHPDLIIAAYKKADDVDRYVLVQTLWLMDDPLVEAFMRSFAFEHRQDEIDDGSSVFALDYLAHRCDLNALARLDRDIFKKYAVMGCSYLEGSVEDAWADAVEAFGRCNYVPAAQNLVHSLGSSCLRSEKAEQSLKQIFPGYCVNYRSPEEKQQCYESLLHPEPKTTRPH